MSKSNALGHPVENAFRGVVMKAVATLLATVALSSNAALTGPIYPAPGGNSFAPAGAPLGFGTRVNIYSGFTPSSYSQLYWGDSVGFSVGIALDGAIDSLSEQITLSIIGPNVAQGTGSTQYVNASNVLVPVVTRFTLTLTDALFNPISLVSGASIGFPTADVVGDVTAATQSGGFIAQLRAEACQPGFVGCLDAAVFYNNQQTAFRPAPVQISFNGAFYYAAPTAVPEPGTLALIALGLAAFALRSRIR